MHIACQSHKSLLYLSIINDHTVDVRIAGVLVLVRSKAKQQSGYVCLGGLTLLDVDHIIVFLADEQDKSGPCCL